MVTKIWNWNEINSICNMSPISLVYWIVFKCKKMYRTGSLSYSHTKQELLNCPEQDLCLTSMIIFFEFCIGSSEKLFFTDQNRRREGSRFANMIILDFEQISIHIDFSTDTKEENEAWTPAWMFHCWGDAMWQFQLLM